jgi:hypothetical protein
LTTERQCNASRSRLACNCAAAQYAIHSPREPEVTGKAKIAAVLDRRFLLELAGVVLPGNVPAGAMIAGRIEVIALQDRHCAIGSTRAHTRHAGQRFLGSTTERNASRRLERTGQARN